MAGCLVFLWQLQKSIEVSAIKSKTRNKSGTQHQKKFVFTIFGETVMTRKKETLNSKQLRQVKLMKQKETCLNRMLSRKKNCGDMHLKNIIHVFELIENDFFHLTS